MMLTFTNFNLKNVTSKISSSFKKCKRLHRFNKSTNSIIKNLNSPKLSRRFKTTNIESELRHSIKNYIQSEGDISKLQDTLNELLEKNEWNISVNEDNIIIDRFHSETELVQIEAITLRSNEYDGHLIVGRGFDEDYHTINFEIRISKPALTKSRLQFMCTLKDDVFTVFDIKTFDGEIYKVIEFNELKEDLQHCILKYMKERGINDDFFKILRTSHEIFFRGFGRDVLSEVDNFVSQK